MKETGQQFEIINKCSHCGSRSEPLLDQQASTMTYVISLLSLVFLGIWGIMIIPLIIQATKTIIKRCHDCQEIVEKHDLFSIPSFNDKVLTFKFGNCAIILSRKYAYVLIAIFVTLYCLYGGRTIDNSTLLDEKNNINSDRTWVKYIRDCGKDQFVSNGVKAKSNFLKYYSNKIFQWEGIFLQATENSKVLDNTYYSLFLKMNPTDSVSDVPDLVLAVQQSLMAGLTEELSNLKKGQIIQFKVKLEHMGDEFTYHIGRLQSLLPTEQMFDLSQLETYTEEKFKQQQLAQNNQDDEVFVGEKAEDNLEIKEENDNNNNNDDNDKKNIIDELNDDQLLQEENADDILMNEDGEIDYAFFNAPYEIDGEMYYDDGEFQFDEFQDGEQDDMFEDGEFNAYDLDIDNVLDDEQIIQEVKDDN